MRVALVRHPSVGIAGGICYGRTDVPLRRGVDLAPIRDRLAGLPDATVFTSPAQRCLTVARALIPDPRVDPRLRELDFGAWEGLAWDDIPRAELDRWANAPLHVAPPGGETGAQLLARVEDFAAGLGRGDSVVVSHGGPLKLLAALLRGEPPDLLAPAPALGSVKIIAC